MMTTEAPDPDELLGAIPRERHRVVREHPSGHLHLTDLDEAVVVTQSVLNEIESMIGSRAAESGGMLGGSRLDGTVTAFHFDESSATSRVTYSPDVVEINRVLREEWDPLHTELLGFVHSHPGHFCRPSSGDERYAELILRVIPDLDQLLMPIVQTGPDTGRFEIRWFAARRAAAGMGVAVHRVEAEVRPSIHLTSAVPRIDLRRVVDAYDVDLLRRSRVVIVGVGGASQFLDDLARTGIGEMVLVDGDIVERQNLATQQVYRSTLRQPKVEALAGRLRDINPAMKVVCVDDYLESLSDLDLERLTTSPLASPVGPAVSLLCGFTDSFPAQARVARAGLQFGVPAMAAQVYEHGRGAEITFALPGLTRACQRCALGARYRAVLHGQIDPAMASAGTPIFATTRLNATKGFVALALMHGAGVMGGATTVEHPGTERWNDLMQRIADRNLVQIRLDPRLHETVGVSTFERVFRRADRRRLVMDETVWLPQDPEHPSTGFATCEDCGGEGDLLAVRGSLVSTALPVTDDSVAPFADGEEQIA